MNQHLIALRQAMTGKRTVQIAGIALLGLFLLGCSSYTGPGIGVPGSDPLVLCEGCGGYSTYNGVCNQCQQIVMEERQFFGHRPTVWNAWPQDWERAEPLDVMAVGTDGSAVRDSAGIAKPPVGKGLRKDAPAVGADRAGQYKVLPASFLNDGKGRSVPADVEIANAEVDHAQSGVALRATLDASPRFVGAGESGVGGHPRSTLEQEPEPRLRQPRVLLPSREAAMAPHSNVEQLTSRLQHWSSPKPQSRAARPASR